MNKWCVVFYKTTTEYINGKWLQTKHNYELYIHSDETVHYYPSIDKISKRLKKEIMSYHNKEMFEEENKSGLNYPSMKYKIRKKDLTNFCYSYQNYFPNIQKKTKDVLNYLFVRDKQKKIFKEELYNYLSGAKDDNDDLIYDYLEYKFKNPVNKEKYCLQIQEKNYLHKKLNKYLCTKYLQKKKKTTNIN